MAHGRHAQAGRPRDGRGPLAGPHATARPRGAAALRRRDAGAAAAEDARQPRRSPPGLARVLRVRAQVQVGVQGGEGAVLARTPLRPPARHQGVRRGAAGRVKQPSGLVALRCTVRNHRRLT